MAKFESGIDEDYDEFVKATQKFVQKMKYSDEIHQVIIEFLKKLTVYFLQNNKFFSKTLKINSIHFQKTIITNVRYSI